MFNKKLVLSTHEQVVLCAPKQVVICAPKQVVICAPKQVVICAPKQVVLFAPNQVVLHALLTDGSAAGGAASDVNETEVDVKYYTEKYRTPLIPSGSL